MNKKEIAIKITNQLFLIDDADEFHWQTEDLLKKSKLELLEILPLCIKSEKAYAEFENKVDEPIRR